jgi:hypothetical protein
VTTAAEKRHLARVASLPCALCGERPVEVHHMRDGQGMGQRASHWLAMPLCIEHHRGQTGIHGDRSAWKLRKMSELDALADTIRRLSA